MTAIGEGMLQANDMLMRESAGGGEHRGNVIVLLTDGATTPAVPWSSPSKNRPRQQHPAPTSSASRSKPGPPFKITRLPRKPRASGRSQEAPGEDIATPATPNNSTRPTRKSNALEKARFTTTEQLRASQPSRPSHSGAIPTRRRTLSPHGAPLPRTLVAQSVPPAPGNRPTTFSGCAAISAPGSAAARSPTTFTRFLPKRATTPGRWPCGHPQSNWCHRRSLCG